jgi:hypothetical protein
MTISSSPDRYTFQKENYVKRREEQGLEPLEEYIEMFKTWKEQDEANMIDPEWRENNMEYDLRSTEWILEKVRKSNSYAQNLYAAMCNTDFQKNEFMPKLAGKTWGCSWRHAGGIIADMKEEGDYIDWYCSGIRNDAPVLLDEQFAELTEEQKNYYIESKSYVGEGHVTDEIKADLKKLGWDVLPDQDDYSV